MTQRWVSREVSWAVVSHTSKAAIRYAAVAATLILFFPLDRSFALFADQISHISSLLVLLVVCMLSVISVHSCLLTLEGEHYKCCCHSL